MGVTIDSLQIEIQSNSTNAAQSIDALAKSLEGLKKNGSFKTVSTNLNHLSQALSGLPNVHQASNALRTLANSIEKLKGVGSVASLSNSLKQLPTALTAVGKIDTNGLETKINGVVAALSSLSQMKAGGLSTMVNAMKTLGKLDFSEITKNLEGDGINKFIEKVQLLNDKLGPLSTKLSTIKSGFSAINSKAREAASGTKKFADDVDTSTLNLSTFIDVARTAIQTMRNLIVWFKGLISGASQWDGIKYQFGNSFGEQADMYYEKITEITDALRINKQAFMENSAMAASMLIGFGVDKSDARAMGLGYTELAYDIWAAFNNVYKSLDGTEGAMAAVRSAIAGEVEPIRRAGFTIVEATLEQTAANHGLNISLANATEAQKSYLRYLELVDQAHRKGIVGTYAREMETAEGLMRTFTQQTKSLSQAFGSLFLPILVKVMPYVQAFVELLTDAVRWVGALFGIEIQDIGDTWTDYSTSVDSAVDNTEGVTGALKDATKAAKELKNASIGIDELNVISPASSTSGSGGAGSGGSGAGTGGGFEGLDVDSLWDKSIFDGVKSKVSDIVKSMKDWLGITEDVDTWAELLGTRFGHILTIVGLIGAGIALWKVSKPLIEFVKLLQSNPTYSIVLSAILLIEGVAIYAQGIMDSIKNGLDGINFAEIVGGGLLGTGMAAYLASIIATWIDTTFSSSAISLAISQAGINLGVGTAGAAGAALASGVAGIIFGIPAMFVGIYDAIVDELGWLNSALVGLGATAAGAGIGTIIGAMGGPIGAGIGALIGLAVGLLTDGVLVVIDILKNGLNETNGIIAAIVAVGLAIMSGGMTAIPTLVIGAVALIIKYWDELKAYTIKLFTETIPNAFESLMSWLADLPNTIEKWFTNLWQPIKDYDWKNLGYNLGNWLGTAIKNSVEFAFVKVPQWLGEKLSIIADAFRTFFTVTLPTFIKEDVPKAFNAIVEFAKGLPEMLWNALVAAYNWRVSIGEAIVNGIIDGLNTIGTAISDFVSGFVDGFKDALGINSPSKVFAEIGKYCVEGLKSTLSVGAIKDKLVAMWTNAKTWWETKKSALKSYTPSIGSIYETLKSRWDSARTWWNDKKTKAKEYTPSIGSIYEKVYDRWKNARDWWNSKKGSFKSYTPSIGSIVDKVKSAWNTAKNWWNKNVKLSTKLNISVPTIKVKWDTASAFGKSFKYPTGFSLKFAANGGIFDQGSLIWAGERGPEVMATASGGRTGVMNVQQMQDAVYEGVYAAVSAAMRGMGSGEQSVNVYLDSKQITAAVERRQRERGASIMGNEVYSY